MNDSSELAELEAENQLLRTAIQGIRAIDPYCDIPVASGLLRVVRLSDIEKALAVLDQSQKPQQPAEG